MKRPAFILFAISLFIGCTSPEKKVENSAEITTEKIFIPTFNQSAAYTFVEEQLSFGSRVPGTEAHVKAGDFLVEKFKKQGAEVTEQTFELSSWDGHQLPLRNIIASYYPQKTKRILLAAHWDSRPYADKDANEPNTPMIAANDGASGVAVLLEIGRILSENEPKNVGVDIILFDGEDWGERVETGYITPPEGYESWWCLGSQYWSKNKHKENYSAFFGILLDMVGARGSQFHVEGLSRRFAPKVVERVWGEAELLGFSNVFVNKVKGEITDDHQFMNKVAKIPTVDIVLYDPNWGYFGEQHHTLQDNLDLIDPIILNIVGQTVTNVVFKEQ